MDKKLFQKYLNNRCTPDELEKTFVWFKEEAGNLHNQMMVQQLWEKYNSSEAGHRNTHFERILDKIHHNINLLNAEKGQIKNTQKLPVPMRQRITSFLTRAAAILFLPVLMALVYTNFMQDSGETETVSNTLGNIEVVAPIGSRTFIELSDGTGVHLNHGSRISYPQKFTGKERKVTLSGEAFFDVAENDEKPFMVDAGDLLITALGTEFNVMAYSDQPALETTLAEGKVLVQKQLPDNRVEIIREMEPGQHLRYLPEENKYSCTTKDIRKYILWKDGLLIFKDNPLKEITLRLSRWYNVEFIYKDESLRDYPFTATFVDETLPQALDLLCLAIPMNYQITPRVKQPDGTFTKQKVIINSEK